MLLPDDRTPNDAAQTRRARHAIVEPLLSAYADGELSSEHTARVDAHLAECARCRRQVAVSAAVDDRLVREPIERVSPALRARILAVTYTAAPSRPRSARWMQWERPIAWSGWLAAAAFGGILLRQPVAGHVSASLPVAAAPSDDEAEVPMVRAAAADFRRTLAQPMLPGRAADLDAVRAALPFPVALLAVPGAELLAAWTTSIRDEPAAALAYRWHDHIVVQYVVSEQLFRRQPAVQRAVRSRGVFTARAGSEGIVAWPGERSGSLLVGAGSPAELLRVPSVPSS